MKKALPIIIVAVLVIGGLAYYFATKNKGSSADNKTTTQSQSSSSNMPDMPGTTTGNEVQQQAQGTNKVTIKDFAFSPANITVKKGTTVTWTNQDSTAHTVTETDGKDGPGSGNLDQGKSYSFTFNTVGTFSYDCSIHPSMTGKVTVTE